MSSRVSRALRRMRYSTTRTPSTTTVTSVVVSITNSYQSGLSANERSVDLHDHRSETHDIQRREEAQHQGEHQLDANFVRTLFRVLSPLRARRLRMNAQRVGDARAESIRLGEHGD